MSVPRHPLPRTRAPGNRPANDARPRAGPVSPWSLGRAYGFARGSIISAPWATFLPCRDCQGGRLARRQCQSPRGRPPARRPDPGGRKFFPRLQFASERFHRAPDALPKSVTILPKISIHFPESRFISALRPNEGKKTHPPSSPCRPLPLSHKTHTAAVLFKTISSRRPFALSSGASRGRAFVF